MAGLRERKKRAQRANMLAAAVDLFRTAGYEQTTMEEIARRAEVSPPTLYSYFPTKEALLVAVFWQAREDSRTFIDPILQNPPEDPIDAITDLIVADMAEMTSPAEKKLWREILAAQVRTHDQPRDEIFSYKFVFESHLQQMLRHLIERGRLSKALDHRVAAKTLYAVTWDVFSDLIADERVKPSDTRKWVEPQVQLILEGWLTAPVAVRPRRRKTRMPSQKSMKHITTTKSSTR